MPGVAFICPRYFPAHSPLNRLAFGSSLIAAVMLFNSQAQSRLPSRPGFVSQVQLPGSPV
ncbi:MAG: hypothetical protein H5U05_06950 [Candidatus Aminicenantes bacterium]|nr:hypothetical protein [Candidatus Aminicenantes bacterium]